jgi:hypothetical protein
VKFVVKYAAKYFIPSANELPADSAGWLSRAPLFARCGGNRSRIIFFLHMPRATGNSLK